jgi:DNA-binding response OmpR family regulator
MTKAKKKPAAAPPAAQVAPATARPTTILMIDDDAFMAGIYGTRLSSEGYAVINAFDGEEGYKKARTELPDLILLDVLMPKLDGFETLKRLKEDASTAKIPVLMLTSLGQKEDVDRGLREGAVDYLIKTQTLPTDALEKIKKVLR